MRAVNINDVWRKERRMQDMECAFLPADILIPKGGEFEKWAVIACDQFTSQPEYWHSVKKYVADQDSTLHMIYPEAELDRGNRCEKISEIHRIMETELPSLQEYKMSYVYVERTLQNGRIRRGVVGMLDLEAYTYQEEQDASVRATEKTVLERIPPRLEIRQQAALDLSHAIVLCDDEQRRLLDSLSNRRQSLPKIYDFELMMGGGRIAGYLVSGKDAAAFSDEVFAYEERKRRLGKTLLYAVGDGNHSLATAKTCYEQLKRQHPTLNTHEHPMRYALVELQDIRDESQQFEPIHRIVKHADVKNLLKELEQFCCGCDGYGIEYVTEHGKGTLHLNCEGGKLPISVLQEFLDEYLKQSPGELDYIHGDDTLVRLAGQAGSVGFLLPPLDKDSLFEGVSAAGVLPRKTFSMGHAREKRYYLESRRLK